jgi:hypothetical protein
MSNGLSSLYGLADPSRLVHGRFATTGSEFPNSRER